LKTPWLGLSAGGAALVAIAANLLLTPRFGPEGAAAATTLAYMTSAGLTYVVAQRVYPVPYRGLRMMALFGVALATGLWLAGHAPAGAGGLALRAGAVLAFAGLCAITRVWKNEGAVAG
jgi:O-antigen/teichoic acid export membrane protein